MNLIQVTNVTPLWRVVFVLSCMCASVLSLPSSYCVEETKNRKLTGIEPYAEGRTKDAHQCISRCIKDTRNNKRPTLCRSVVYSSTDRRCRRYLIAVTRNQTLVQLRRAEEHEELAYYEILDKCSDKLLVNNLPDTKRRDEGDNTLDGGAESPPSSESESRALAEKQPAAGPPGLMPSDVIMPNKGGDVAAQPQQQQQVYQGRIDGGLAQPAQPSYQGIQSVETYQMRPLAPQPSCCSPPQATSCCNTVVIHMPQPQPQQCCPAPQPQPCCPAPQPKPCCPAPQPQPCCPAPQPQPCCPPPPQPACCPQPPPPQWGPWSAWTECFQQPCAPGGGGGTVQTRTRQCQGQGQCPGESQQQQPCGCLQGQWTEWGPPTPCSCTCGDGMQSRTRTCTVPGTCQGPDTDQGSCNMGPCPQWSEWAEPQPCPVTCGQGSTMRQRTCTDGQGGQMSGCFGPDTEPQPCPSLPPCCQPWTAWTPCSSTCGSGMQSRSMTCQGAPGSMEQQPCANPQPCCSDWSQWSGCQVVCGQGYQTRTRTCGSSGSGGGAGGGIYYGGRAGAGAVGGGGVMGSPSLPTQSGCCNTQQQQSCSVGCSPNTFYAGQQQFYGGRRRKRAAKLTAASRSANNTMV